MTREEFAKTSFRAGDTFTYKGQEYNVASVDFEEDLIAYDMADEDDEDIELRWVRCESIDSYTPYDNTNEKKVHDLIAKMCDDIRNTSLTADEIADKYIDASKPEYRQAVIRKINELRNS